MITEAQLRIVRMHLHLWRTVQRRLERRARLYRWILRGIPADSGRLAGSLGSGGQGLAAASGGEFAGRNQVHIRFLGDQRAVP